MSPRRDVTPRVDRTAFGANQGERPAAKSERTEPQHKQALHVAAQTTRQSRLHPGAEADQAYAKGPEELPEEDADEAMMEVFEEVERRIDRLLQRSDRTL